MADNANLSIDSDNALFVDTTSNRVGINTSDPKGTLHVNGSVYFEVGNVGIGTTSPGNLLTLVNSGGVYIDLKGTASATDDMGFLYRNMSGTIVGYLLYNDGSSSNWDPGFKFYAGGGSSSDIKMIITPSGNVGIGSLFPSTRLQIEGSASNGLALNVSDVLYVNGSSGYVGIGTTSPQELLHVQASADVKAEFEATGATSDAILRLKALDGRNTVLEFASNNSDTEGRIVYAAGSENKMKFRTNGDNDRMIIDGSGNVGIGTSSPTAKLQIEGNASTGLSLNVSGILYVNKSSGNVGIGNSSPGDKLHISGGNVRFDGSQLNFYNGVDTQVEIVNREGGGFGFWTDDGSGSQNIVFSDTGNVGIGDTAPSDKLDVSGNATITGGFHPQSWFYRSSGTGTAPTNGFSNVSIQFPEYRASYMLMLAMYGSDNTEIAETYIVDSAISAINLGWAQLSSHSYSEGSISLATQNGAGEYAYNVNSNNWLNVTFNAPDGSTGIWTWSYFIIGTDNG